METRRKLNIIPTSTISLKWRSQIFDDFLHRSSVLSRQRHTHTTTLGQWSIETHRFPYMAGHQFKAVSFQLILTKTKARIWCWLDKVTTLPLWHRVRWLRHRHVFKSVPLLNSCVFVTDLRTTTTALHNLLLSTTQYTQGAPFRNLTPTHFPPHLGLVDLSSYKISPIQPQYNKVRVLIGRMCIKMTIKRRDDQTITCVSIKFWLDVYWFLFSAVYCQLLHYNFKINP